MTTDNSVVMTRGKMERGLEGGGQREKNGNICNGVNNKKFFK